MALENIRSRLATTAGDAWDLDDEEISAFRQVLDDSAASLDISDEFRNCAEQADFQSCLEDFADDLRDAFRGDWEDAPTSLRDNLRGIRDAWSEDERDAAREIALDADLDRLNRLCARGQIDDVEDELNMDTVSDAGGPGSITNFRECVEAVSVAQDLSGALKDAWGTNGG